MARLDLRKILFIDAFTCFATGALMAGASDALAALTHIPAGLLLYAGLSLFPIAALMAFVGKRASDRAALVWLLVVGNALWVAGSVWLLLGGAIAPNGLGKAFLALQAVVVLVLTVLEAETFLAPSAARVRAA